ncbi:MAG: methyltransferase [Saprospiraceae bacterium]|jgi:hypothetical protein
MEDSKKQTPVPQQAFDLFTGWALAHVAYNLTKLNVFESIGSGSKSVTELASACNLHERVLYRTLRFAAKKGVVRLEDRQVSLTDLGKFFLKDTPGSMANTILFLNEPPWRDSWHHFAHSLQNGAPAFDHVMGKPFFDYLDENQQYGKPFNDMSTVRTTMLAPLIAQSYDFSGFRTICDVGGGQGILLKTILEKNPQAQGILYDLESAMHGDLIDGLGGRATKVSGNFFESVPAADCMVLKHIIHDWSDENSVRILQRCKAGLKENGRVLLVENVLQEPFDAITLFYDLHMQVMIGGAERTEAEYGELLAAAGLKLNRIIDTPSPVKIVEAV